MSEAPTPPVVVPPSPTADRNALARSPMRRPAGMVPSSPSRPTTPNPFVGTPLESPSYATAPTLFPPTMAPTPVPAISASAPSITIPVPETARAVTPVRVRSPKPSGKQTPTQSALHAAAGLTLHSNLGQLVDDKHEHHQLVYIMILGIRTAVSRANNVPIAAELTVDDSMYIERYKFLRDGSEKTPAHKCSDFKFQDYAPLIFRMLRETFFDASEFLLSLTQDYVLSELSSPGKSKSFFYFSKDLKYVIKTMTHEEAFTLRKMLYEYYRFLRENPNTLLTKICGMYRLKPHRGPKIYFHVMQNVFTPGLEVHRRYDLKGSTVGRTVGAENFSKPYIVLKDLDFLNRHDKILLGPRKTRIFLEQLARDVEFLASQNVMDYSLLMGVHNRSISDMPQPIPDAAAAVEHKELDHSTDAHTGRPKTIASSVFMADGGGFAATNADEQSLYFIYCLGIIDYLQSYNARKTMENMYKGLLYDREGISSIPPDQYAKRLIDFVRSQTSCDPKDAALAEEQELWITCAHCHVKIPAGARDDHAMRCEQRVRTGLKQVSAKAPTLDEPSTRMCESCHGDIPVAEFAAHVRVCTAPHTTCPLCNEDMPLTGTEAHAATCAGRAWEADGVLRGTILKNLGTRRDPKWKSRYYELSLHTSELSQWNDIALRETEPRRYPLLSRFMGVQMQPHKKPSVFRMMLLPKPGIKPLFLGCTTKTERAKWVAAFERVFENAAAAPLRCVLCGVPVPPSETEAHSAVCIASKPPETTVDMTSVLCNVCHKRIPLDAVEEHSRTCSVQSRHVPMDVSQPMTDDSGCASPNVSCAEGAMSGAIGGRSDSSAGQTWDSSMCSDSESGSGTGDEYYSSSEHGGESDHVGLADPGSPMPHPHHHHHHHRVMSAAAALRARPDQRRRRHRESAPPGGMSFPSNAV